MTEEMGHIILGHLEYIDAQVKEIAKTLREVNNIASRIEESLGEAATELQKMREKESFCLA